MSVHYCQIPDLGREVSILLNQVTENCSVRIKASSDVRQTQEKPEIDS